MVPVLCVFVADAGAKAGLGHVSRSTAVAAALRSRRVETRCFANGPYEAFERDGLVWTPLDADTVRGLEGTILVVDTYSLTLDEQSEAATSNRLVVMHDGGDVPEGAVVVVSVGSPSRGGDVQWLTGLRYAALRAGFWGLPSRRIRPSVERILVTTGSGEFGTLGRQIAGALADALPDVRVAAVRGPHANLDTSDRIETLDAPESLLEPLLEADLVVTAAGQTMLEAVATGAPSVALPLIENQARQAELLAECGAVRLVTSADVPEVASAAVELARSTDARRELSANGQAAVDGYGALRIAYHLARLATA